jgi:hypothetical protein
VESIIGVKLKGAIPAEIQSKMYLTQLCRQIHFHRKGLRYQSHREQNHVRKSLEGKGFERSLTSSRIPSKSIERYPVVARWRNDVDYVAAGIFCVQPYCVTGELDPPANPLICPQFCVRFNDLENIGHTGRHYSGFVMLGIQVFNAPDKYVFFKKQCVEFNY